MVDGDGMTMNHRASTININHTFFIQLSSRALCLQVILWLMGYSAITGWARIRQGHPPSFLR